MRISLLRLISSYITAAGAFVSVFASLNAVAAGVAAARLPASGWTGQVGIPGGIPTTYTQFCNVRVSIPGSPLVATGDGVTDDSPAIQAAVKLCPNNQYVYIPAGDYRLNTTITRTGVNAYDNVQRPYSIAIKGDGPSLTKLYFYGSGTALTFNPANSTDARTMTIVSGNTRGSTSLVLGSIDPYLAVNLWMVVKRVNSETGALNVTAEQSGYEANAASQLVKVTAINTSTKTVTFTPALNEGYPSDFVTIGISQPYRCGIQDLYIENKTNSGGHNIHIFYGAECWIQNVESNMASKWHFRLQTCARSEVRECFVHDGWGGGGDSIYGVGLFQWSCNNLVENNIAVHCRHSYIMEYGGQNNVFAYNYSKDPINADHGDNSTGIQGGSPGQLATDYLMGDLILHGGEPRWNLFEGNVAATIRWDDVLGGSGTNTAFRNRIQRKGLPSTLYACFGSDIQRWNYNANLLANVYEPAPATFTEGLRRWGSDQDNVTNADATSQASSYVDGETELATGVTSWATSDHSLPSSYYLTSKPAFFGSSNWPIFGPEYLSNPVSGLPAVTRFLGLNKITTLAAPANVRVGP